MPEERLLQAYADWTGTSLKPQPLPVTVNEPPEEYESPSGAPSWTYLLVIAIVIGAVLWWFGSGDGTTQAPEAKVGDGITPLQIEESPLIMQPLPLGPTADNTVAPAQPGDVAGSTSGTQLMTEGAAAPGAEASRAGASSTPAGETQPATPPGPATLRLSFTQTSWVEIYDDDNKRLAYGLLSPGTEQQVNGKPPYEVLLGRPQGVQLSMGGRVIDLAPYIAPNGTARFKLKAP
jgi:cytoskeleton protein RodZ